MLKHKESGANSQTGTIRNSGWEDKVGQRFKKCNLKPTVEGPFQ